MAEERMFGAKTNILRHVAAALAHRPVRTMDNVILNLGLEYTVSAGKPTPRFRHKVCGRSLIMIASRIEAQRGNLDTAARL